MVEVIYHTEKRARKDYTCDLYEDFREVNLPNDLTEAEQQAVAIYSGKKGKILKGDLYVRQFNKFEGQPCTWRADKAMFDLFCKYKLLRDE